MKKTLLVILAVLFGSLTQMHADTAWVQLNNGSIIKGNVSQNGTTVSIVADNGRVYTYPLTEVYKITAEEPVLPPVSKNTGLNDYATNDTGFWMRTTLQGAYTVFLSSRCTPLTEFDIAGGYRFNQYLKAGIGFGARYYFNNDDLRCSSIDWSFPIYATVTGNIIDDTYRNVVPYYTFDMGGAIRDGFMWRPSIGIRIGQPRSAFLLALTYTGQSLKYKTGSDKYVSSVGITLGYEF